MRTIGKKWQNLVKRETIKAIKKRDKERAGEVMRYYGIDNEIIDNLPDEIWQTWEGAYDEIKRIIEETMQDYDPEAII